MKNNKIKFAILIICITILCVMCLYYNHQYHTTSEALANIENEIIVVQNELNFNKIEFQSKVDELNLVQENLKIETEKSLGLSEALGDIRKELESANTTISDLKNIEYELVYLGEFKLTHYCIEEFEHICGNGNGLTATGTKVTPGQTVAVDPTVIPYGTEIYIEGYGWRIAEDCGGAVQNNHIDIAVSTHSEAMDAGIQNGGVWLLVKKDS